MLNNISWLIYGPRIKEDRLKPIFLLSKILSVSRYRHQKKTAFNFEALLSQARSLLRMSQAPKVLVEIFQESIDFLLEFDETLAYFVVFCATQLNPSSFVESLHLNSLSQDLIAGKLERLNIERIPGNTFLLQERLIWLPFDISPSLRNLSFPEKPKESTILDPIGEPVNDIGQLNVKYYNLLKSQLLRKARRNKQNISLTLGTDTDDEIAIQGFLFNKQAFFHNLISMYEGTSSDLFLQDKQGIFYIRENSEIEYDDIRLQIMETKSFLMQFVSLANDFLQQKHDLIRLELTSSRRSIVKSWQYQLETIRPTIRGFSKRQDVTMLRMFSVLMDYLRDKYSLTTYIKNLIQTSLSDLELSMSLLQSYKLSRQPHFKYMLIDLNRFIALSWIKYLSQSEAADEDDYVREFCPYQEPSQNKVGDIVTTSLLIRKMKDNLNISKEFDELYEDTATESTSFEDLDTVVKDADPLDVLSMSIAVLKPYTSPVRIKTLISDYEDAMKLITEVFFPMSSHRMLQASEITMSNLLSLGVKRRHILKLNMDNDKIIYEAPAPLDLIITDNHSMRLQSTRTQFLLLSAAYKALLQIDMKDNCFCVGEDRVAFFRRNKMLTIIRALLNHVASTVRYIQKEMDEELKKATSIQDLINVQRRMMRYLVKRTRLETRNNATSSIITNLADFSSRFAAAFSKGDARSCEIHYNEFYGYIRILVESLHSETENDYAKLILVQLNSWDFLDSRRSESLSKRSLISHSDSEQNF